MKRGNSIAFSNIRAYVSVTESSLNLFPIILKNSDIQRYVLFRVEFYFWSFTSEMTSEMSVLWHVHVLIQTMLFVHMLIAFVFITTRKKKTQTKSILLVFVVLNEDIIYTSKHLFNLLANVESCELMISVMLWSFLGKKSHVVVIFSDVLCVVCDTWFRTAESPLLLWCDTFHPKGFYPDSDDSSITISVIATHVNWLAWSQLFKGL